MSDESMWSEFDGLWGLALEELEEPFVGDMNGVSHPAPDFDEKGGEFDED